jgi:hypothetical protein
MPEVSTVVVPRRDVRVRCRWRTFPAIPETRCYLVRHSIPYILYYLSSQRTSPNDEDSNRYQPLPRHSGAHHDAPPADHHVYLRLYDATGGVSLAAVRPAAEGSYPLSQTHPRYSLKRRRLELEMAFSDLGVRIHWP